MSGVKETSELLRAGSAVLIEYLDAVADGEFGLVDKLKFIGLYSTIARGVRDASKIGAELQDLDPVEKDALIAEIKETLARTGKFTFRERDIAERVLALVYFNVREISAILHLPLTAIAANPNEP